jgi:hypothetical protein
MRERSTAMSRYYDDCEDGAMPAQLWEANLERAIKGKRGQQVLRDLRDALTALPQPRLIEGALCTVNPLQRMAQAPDNWLAHTEIGAKVDEQGEGVCGVGAYLWWQNVKAGMTAEEAFAALPTMADETSDLWETADLARKAGVTFTLAWHLAYRNDETLGHLSPEERHTRFIAWIDSKLSKGAVA